MKTNKIIIFFLFILKSLYINCSYILIDVLFKFIDIQSPTCYNNDMKLNRYRGAIKNFDDIKDSLIADYNKLSNNSIYEYIYFDTMDKLKQYIDYIPKTTLIFSSFPIYYTEINRDICFVKIKKWSKYHYIYITDNKFTYLALPLIFCYVYITIAIEVYRGYKESLRVLSTYRNIYFYKFVTYIILLSIPISLSYVTIYYFLISYLFYSIYKSYLLINLILLLQGFSIIHFNHTEIKYIKYISIIFLFDFLMSLISEYIVYFFPTVNNFYLFHLKSIIEHVTLLIITFVYFHAKYVHMYKQYMLEKRLGTILSRTYQIKMIIYIKINIFSLVYCSIFIILPFIELFYIKIDNCVETFYINYFITICIELFLNIALSVLLRPQDLTLYFFLPTIFDYNTFKFEVKIKNNCEDKLNISNLTHNLLENEFGEKDYPLIFITPYGKTNKVFNSLVAGSIEKSNPA